MCLHAKVEKYNLFPEIEFIHTKRQFITAFKYSVADKLFVQSDATN